MKVGWAIFSFAILGFFLWQPSSCLKRKGQKNMVNFEEARQNMIEVQLKGRDIKDSLVLEAMQKVKRHEFVPAAAQGEAYGDGPIPIGHGQTISQPYVVAFMTQVLRPNKKHKVLEIGTGSGYQAAVLAELVKEVNTIEIVEELCKQTQHLFAKLKYKNINTRCGDGYSGWVKKAPFDLIILTAAPPQIPEPLIEQLAIGGRLVAPVGDAFQELVLLEKQKDESIKKSTLLAVRFVPMTGKAQKAKGSQSTD